MKALENQIFLVAYIISNALAIIFLVCSIIWPRVGRLLYVLLFAWASWANWNMAMNNPQDYLSYADLVFFPGYRSFILGWFSNHIQLSVGLIATAQGVIALLLAMKGFLYRVALIGGILFLVAIIPLGLGSAFPCTLILAIGLILLSSQDLWLWQPRNRSSVMSIE